jgi:hypothetical protein
MADRENLEVGNNSINADAEFTDGYCNGSLYYYDTNHQLPRPLTSEAVYTFMTDNLCDERATARWNAGFVFGWVTALCENNPAYFFASLVMPESTRNTEPLPVLLPEA